ncbi:7_t:CDS:2, partial [Acaulospora morrowiae]
LLLFADYLESDFNIKKKDDIAHWVEFTKIFFDENTSMNYNSGSRKFEIKYQLIPRFYQTFFESGVTKIQLILGITQESIQHNNGILVECKSASIMYHYENGMQVVETGRLSVTFVNMKITNFEFEAEKYTEYVPRQLLNEFITNSQENLINGHGIPHKTMRCLEVGEGVDYMQEVMTVTINNPNIGPLEALRIIASQNSNPNVAAPMVNHPLEMSSSPSQSVSKKDIKNDVSNFSGAPPTPNANDLQTSASTPVGTPTPMHTPTPTPKSTPSPLVMNNGSIGSPHPKLSVKSPAIGENTVKRPNDGGFNANKKRPRPLKSPKKQ